MSQKSSRAATSGVGLQKESRGGNKTCKPDDQRSQARMAEYAVCGTNLHVLKAKKAHGNSHRCQQFTSPELPAIVTCDNTQTTASVDSCMKHRSQTLIRSPSSARSCGCGRRDVQTGITHTAAAMYFGSAPIVVVLRLCPMPSRDIRMAKSDSCISSRSRKYSL